MPHVDEPPVAPGPTLAEVDEDRLLALIVPAMPTTGPEVLVGPGDDTALLRSAGRMLATTDTMVRGRDWREEWSSAGDVGAKLVAQNVADLAAMGGWPTGLLVTLVADPATPVAWAVDFARGLGAAARDAGVSVIGGDLSSAPPGMLAVSMTALGDLDGEPVGRCGAQPGDVVAVCGTLGRSAAGFVLLQANRASDDPELVAAHRRPRPPYEGGPQAAAGGAHAMVDLSDGLVRDAGRVARASGVRLALEAAPLRPYVERLRDAVGEPGAWECVLTGGEEHSLLGTFERAPAGWQVIGRVEAGAGVTLDGAPQAGGGWDHFGPGAGA